MIAQGKGRREIAHELGITYGTTRGHVAEALRRLDAPNVAAAIWAVRRELES